MRTRQSSGFTLLELLFALLIAMALIVAALAMLQKATQRSRAAEAQTLVGSILSAQLGYYQEHETFTGQIGDLPTLRIPSPTDFEYAVPGVTADAVTVTGRGLADRPTAGILVTGTINRAGIRQLAMVFDATPGDGSGGTAGSSGSGGGVGTLGGGGGGTAGGTSGGATGGTTGGTTGSSSTQTAAAAQAAAQVASYRAAAAQQAAMFNIGMDLNNEYTKRFQAVQAQEAQVARARASGDASSIAGEEAQLARMKAWLAKVRERMDFVARAYNAEIQKNPVPAQYFRWRNGRVEASE